MNYETAEDFVIGSSVGRSVKQLIEIAFEYVGIKLKWNETITEGIDLVTKKTVVRVSDKYFRPLEVNKLIADPSKAKKLLNWSPQISFEKMIKEMIDSDFNKLNNEIKKI